MTDRSCSVVDSIDCEAAPDYDAPASKIVVCRSCGRDVCRVCSSVIPYRVLGPYRASRICFDCQDELKIGRAGLMVEEVRAHAIVSNLRSA